jgi:S-adenosylmethionine:tRNA ribosyltransferase-isomerase
LIFHRVQRYNRRNVHVSDFEFDLPEDLIAQEAAERGTARLLVLDRATGAIRHALRANATEQRC